MVDKKVKKLAQLLKEKGWSVTTAESCTGGAVAMNLTEMAGSSAWFNAGFVTYSNQMKSQMLGVTEQTLTEFGAVSEPVVKEMAEGALERASADMAVAISGIAGPGGGTVEKPVGTVCFAWAVRGRQTRMETHCFAGDRHAVRQSAVDCALQGLLDEIH